MEKTSTETKQRIPSWVKRVVPILVSVLIMYYYFHDQDWGKLKEATSEANITLAVLALLIPQLVFWFFEVLLTDRHFTWFHEPFPWKTFTWVRGAMYLLILINPTVAGGGIFLYLQRKTKASWSKLMGMALFRFGLTIWAITLLMIPASLAMHYHHIFDKTKLNFWMWWGFLIFGVLWFIDAWIAWHHDKHIGFSKIIVKDRDSEFWTAFRMATKKQWLLTFVMGVVPFFFMLFGFWVLALAFGVKIPLLNYMVVSPLVMLIADMPLSFGGFGTTTMAWLIFFKEYGDEESIRSLTLFLPFARAAIRAVIGFCTIGIAMKDINMLLQGPEDVAASESEPGTD